MYFHSKKLLGNKYTGYFAALNNHLNILIWLREAKMCDFGVDTFIGAICSENLEIIKWLHKIKCCWNTEVCNQAVIYQQLECLKYLRENGCPWNREICLQYARTYHHENDTLVNWILEN